MLPFSLPRRRRSASCLAALCRRAHEGLTCATARARMYPLQLDEVDTSSNSLESWLEFLRVTHFHKPRSHGIQHVDRKLALKCAMEVQHKSPEPAVKRPITRPKTAS
jgi:hypothetical protein